MAISPALRAAVEEPPRTRARVPELLAGLGGTLRARPEDFAVEEIPAYEPDGRPGHLLVWMRKRSLTTEQAVREVAQQLQLKRAEIGVAGLKDRHAVTRQQISVPERGAARLASFRHPGVELGDPRPHSHKLRRGHLQGNRFEIILRELALAPALARDRARALLHAISTLGLRNYYGAQRFGHETRNLEPGLAALAGRRRAKLGDLTLSAGQSALFNLYLARRVERGLDAQVLLGDLLARRSTGGLFESSDPVVDQRRLDDGELVMTGPMFGSKTRAPAADTPAAALEAEILAEAGLTRAKLARLGRRAPGTRRWLHVWPALTAVTAAPAVGELAAGVSIEFALPAGSYATVLLRELT